MKTILEDGMNNMARFETLEYRIVGSPGGEKQKCRREQLQQEEHKARKERCRGHTYEGCKNIHIKDADSNINKYILTENTRASKKNTAHTWRQEMRYIQSRGHLERSSPTHNGSSISKSNQSDSRLSSGGNKLFRTVFEVINL